MSGPSIVLGVPLMDEDHFILENLLARAASVEDAELPELLKRVEAETRAHFCREEELMRESALTVVACHTIQHEMFLGQFRLGRARLDDGDFKGLRAFLAEGLPVAFSRHINTADRVAAGMLMDCRS